MDWQDIELDLDEDENNPGDPQRIPSSVIKALFWIVVIMIAWSLMVTLLGALH